MKFPLADADGFRRRLGALGAVASAAVVQSDAYFNHPSSNQPSSDAEPSRDFAVTDQALRVRTVGDDAVVTYKGPRRQGTQRGGVAKTRFELELPLAPGTAEGWRELLIRLGFFPVATVRKTRTPHALQRDGRRFEVTIDEVEGLGVYAEVETLAEEVDLATAETAVVNLAAELGLTDSEPRSYLEMLLGRLER